MGLWAPFLELDIQRAAVMMFSRDANLGEPRTSSDLLADTKGFEGMKINSSTLKCHHWRILQEKPKYMAQIHSKPGNQ
ncbi:hypothetical protein TURU_152398 [Turdus rufiventris]|nr:hypothetical protein TURU_152398 [Turdus rufiventris]